MSLTNQQKRTFHKFHDMLLQPLRHKQTDESTDRQSWQVQKKVYLLHTGII